MIRAAIAALALAATLPVGLAFPQDGPDRAELERQLKRLEAQQAEIRDRLAGLDAAEPAPERSAEPADRRARFQRFLDSRAGESPAEFLGAIDPEMRERFERMREENPELARRFIERHRERLRDLREMRERDPEAFEQRAELMRSMREAGFLASQIAVLESAGNVDEARERRDELRSLIERLVDLRLDRQREKMAEIETRLEEARSELEQMEARRGELVDEHLEKAVDRARQRLENARGAGAGAP